MAFIRILAVCAALGALSSSAISVGSLASRLHRVESMDGINPVKRVVGLLTEMQATLQKEMEDDQTLYNKLVCWCHTNEHEKDSAISASDAKIAELESTIESLTARSGGLGEKLAELASEIKSDKSALAEATAIREKELAQFNEENVDRTQALENLKAAIIVLSKHHKDAAFPQMPLALISLSDSGDDSQGSGFLQSRNTEGWSDDELATVQKAFKSAKSFMQAHNADDYTPTYKAQSGEIMGVLNQLLEEMQGDHNEANQEEENRAASFAELRSAKESEIKNNEAMEQQKQDELATTNNDNAEAKEDLEQETNALSEAQKFMKELKSTCATADENFEERKKSRLQEIQAVSETIGILQADDARDNMTSTYDSFVQVRSHREMRDGRRREAADLIRHSATNPEMSMLASQVELDSFTKVKAAIDKMVAQLEQQQKDEVKKQDYCKKSIQENEMSTERNTDTKADLEAKIGSLASKITALVEGIANSNKLLSQAQVDLQAASEDRLQENQDYQKTVADQTAVIEVLHKALDRLAKFYNQASLVQVSRRDDPNAPPVAQKEYEPNKAAGGVQSMIQKLVAEAKELVAESKKSENEAQGSYERMVADTNSAVKGFMDQIATKTQEKADTHKEKLRTESDLDGTNTELGELAKLNQELHDECDEVLRNFDVRQEARQQEVEALKQAKQILSGASMS